MSQISLTFPDGNSRRFDRGVTPGEVAADISTSLGKKAISATVNGADAVAKSPAGDAAKATGEKAAEGAKATASTTEKGAKAAGSATAEGAKATADGAKKIGTGITGAVTGKDSKK